MKTYTLVTENMTFTIPELMYEGFKAIYWMECEKGGSELSYEDWLKIELISIYRKSKKSK